MIDLSLTEALYCLALRDEKDKIHDSVAMSVHYGLGGAILAELALLNMVDVDSKGKVMGLQADPSGDVILDGAYLKILESKKVFKINHWIEEFSSNSRKFQKQLTERLVGKGILMTEDQKVSWVVPFNGHAKIDASARYWIKHDLREVLLAGLKADEKTIALLGLMRVCGMLPFLYTVDEQKLARRRMSSLANDNSNAKPLKDALEIIEASGSTAAMKASMR